VVEYLPSKHDKALEFQSPVLPKKKKKSYIGFSFSREGKFLTFHFGYSKDEKFLNEMDNRDQL
jgi:hypothetical protein